MTVMEGQSQAETEQFQLSPELNQRMLEAILEKQRRSASSGQVQVSSIESFRRHFNQFKDRQSLTTFNTPKHPQNASHQNQPSPQSLNNTLHSQKLLKEYFQSYFSAIFAKMQQATALKLQAITTRLQNIQTHLNQQRKITLLSALSRPQKPLIRPQRKSTYIKNREKLDYIDKIQRGKTTIQQVALALNINQKIVRSWLTSKQSFKEKQYKKQREHSGDHDDMML